MQRKAFSLQQITIQTFYNTSVYAYTREKNLILQYRDQILLMSACTHTNIVECSNCDLLEG